MKTILVPVSGTSTDERVLATALALARPLSAHLDFYHVRLSEIEAAAHAPQAEFCVGDALPVAWELLRQREEERSCKAELQVQSFCRENCIDKLDAPCARTGVSAAYLQERDGARERLLLRGRHADLIVLGRPSHIDYMPGSLMQDLLVGCGRPIVIAPDFPPQTVTGRIVVGWKETPEAARALGSAWPLLEQAHEVVLLHLAGEGSGSGAGLEHLARQLEWHGITAEIKLIETGNEHPPYQLAREAAELRADLLVVGAFGHSRLREIVFGGVTRSLLEHANVPVLMMH
ncbi:MAG TPA: universal stress protein [Steroidobacteraceae bacterium]|nr:universal stress protein [Steroidobacteraceae bacterium]